MGSKNLSIRVHGKPRIKKNYYNISNKCRTNKFPDFPLNLFPAKSATQSCRISSRNSRINNFPCCVYDAFRVFPSPFIPKFSLFTQIRENIFLHERQREISLLPDIFSYSTFTIVKILCFNFFWQFFFSYSRIFRCLPAECEVNEWALHKFWKGRSYVITHNIVDEEFGCAQERGREMNSEWMQLPSDKETFLLGLLVSDVEAWDDGKLHKFKCLITPRPRPSLAYFLNNIFRLSERSFARVRWTDNAKLDWNVLLFAFTSAAFPFGTKTFFSRASLLLLFRVGKRVFATIQRNFDSCCRVCSYKMFTKRETLTFNPALVTAKNSQTT